MERKRRGSGIGWLLLKAAILAGAGAAADRFAHSSGLESGFLMSLSFTLSRLTGLADNHCFALIVMVGLFACLEIAAGIVSVLAGR